MPRIPDFRSICWIGIEFRHRLYCTTAAFTFSGPSHQSPINELSEHLWLRHGTNDWLATWQLMCAYVTCRGNNEATATHTHKSPTPHLNPLDDHHHHHRGPTLPAPPLSLCFDQSLLHQLLSCCFLSDTRYV